MKKKFYVIPVFGCVEPDRIGPFASYKSMLRRARKEYFKQDEEDAIFWAMVQGNRLVTMGSFTNDELGSDDN